MNTYRKFISTGVGFTFVVVGFTGICFQFFFKNRVLEQIHGWLGIVMVVAAVIHIIQNWKPLVGYFRDWHVFVLLVPMFLVMGMFLFGQGDEGQGVNPWLVFDKLSQANVQNLAETFGKDVDSVFASMKSDGLKVGNTDETVQQLAQRNQKSPEGILGYFVK